MPRLMNIIYGVAILTVGNFALQGIDPKEGNVTYAKDKAASKADADEVAKIAKARKK
jgi:hypothetical protein